MILRLFGLVVAGTLDLGRFSCGLINLANFGLFVKFCRNYYVCITYLLFGVVYINYENLGVVDARV